MQHGIQNLIKRHELSSVGRMTKAKIDSHTRADVETYIEKRQNVLEKSGERPVFTYPRDLPDQGRTQQGFPLAILASS
jgi:hypothetical protein